MKNSFEEAYVKEILAGMPAGLSEQQFRDRCKADLNARYFNEVDEAYRRYAAPTSGRGS